MKNFKIILKNTAIYFVLKKIISAKEFLFFFAQPFSYVCYCYAHKINFLEWISSNKRIFSKRKLKREGGGMKMKTEPKSWECYKVKSHLNVTSE
jgi:hypothetical protein